MWPDEAREEIRGRDELLELITDEKKLAYITAKSTEPIRHIMRQVRQMLDTQAALLHPIKPRVLFSALGERHTEQIARIASGQVKTSRPALGGDRYCGGEEEGSLGSESR